MTLLYFKDEEDQERKEAFLGYLKHLEDTNLTMTTKNIVENRSRMKKIILEILSELDSEPPVSSTIPSNLPIIRGTTEHSRALRPVQVCLSKFNLDFILILFKFHPYRIRINTSFSSSNTQFYKFRISISPIAIFFFLI
jgi:hypothetical protein